MCHCVYTCEDLLFTQVCRDPAALFRAKYLVNCSLVLCKTGWQQACVTAVTPVQMYSSYRCAVIQHWFTAVLFRAKCIVDCSLGDSRLVSLHLHL